MKKLSQEFIDQIMKVISESEVLNESEKDYMSDELSIYFNETYYKDDLQEEIIEEYKNSDEFKELEEKAQRYEDLSE